MTTEKKLLSDEGFQTIFEFFKVAAEQPETFDKKKCYHYIGLLLNHADLLVKQFNSKEHQNDDTGAKAARRSQ